MENLWKSRQLLLRSSLIPTVNTSCWFSLLHRTMSVRIFSIIGGLTMSQWGVILLVILAGCSQESGGLPETTSNPSVESSAASGLDTTTPVPTNRGRDVQVGFRGDVHPALANQRLKVTAVCSPVGKGQGFAAGYFPQQFRGPFEAFAVETPVRNYSAHDLSGFLPETFEQPGQIWEIDVNRIAAFMKQFDSGASMQLTAPGRRAAAESSITRRNRRALSGWP